MKDFLDKAPFVRLLPPLLAGIFLQCFLGVSVYAPFVLAVGFFLLTASFFLPRLYRYSLRPLFGIGISLTVLAFGIFITAERQQQTLFVFPQQEETCIAEVLEVPQAKPRSIACQLRLQDAENHKVICYFQSDSMSRSLEPGDKVLVYMQVRPFRNRGNPDDFDYATYMRYRGFAGTAYVGSSRWEKLHSDDVSLYASSQRWRSQLLSFYRTLHLEHHHFAVFSALTLGYMDELDDSLQQSFRATGTSHILSVSGLHVAIIYMVIASLLSFLPKRRGAMVVRQTSIICLLWVYAFLVGLPPSVVRATLMISVFCVAVAIRRQAFSFNTICFAPFIMLFLNPFEVFNIGFQLSLAAVLSMAFFSPVLFKFYMPSHPVAKFFWEMFAVSIAVQLGTYPICLYYFGTFPTYFFLTNLVIVPLSTLVMYSSLCVYLAAFASWLLPACSGALFAIPVWVLNFLLKVLLASVHFFESLPYSMLEHLFISLPQVFVMIVLSGSLALFFYRFRPPSLMLAMASLTLFLVMGLPAFGKQKDDSIYIFNRPDRLEIGRVGEALFVSDTSIHRSVFFPKIYRKKLAIVKSDLWLGRKAVERFAVDVLVLSGRDSLSMYHLNKLFETKQVILDGTVSSKSSRRLQRECKKLSIDCYDVKEKGAFRIKNY